MPREGGKDEARRSMNKIECVIHCEELDALDPLFLHLVLRFVLYRCNMHEIIVQQSLGQRSDIQSHFLMAEQSL